MDVFVDFDSLLDPDEQSLPEAGEERRRRAKEARSRQISQFEEWERELGPAGGSTRAPPRNGGRRRRSSKKKAVSFQPGEILRDAVTRSDLQEGGAGIAHTSLAGIQLDVAC